MKTLQQMNNVEKGKLLADLLPHELEGIIKEIQEYYQFLNENKAEAYKDWNFPFITAEMWHKLAEEVNDITMTEGKQLLKPRRFSDQLFDGYLAFFTVDCIMKYVERDKMNSKLYHLANALFNFEL